LVYNGTFFSFFKNLVLKLYFFIPLIFLFYNEEN